MNTILSTTATTAPMVTLATNADAVLDTRECMTNPAATIPKLTTHAV